eukprot:403370158
MTIFITIQLIYRYIVAWIKGYDVLSIQDTLCLYDSDDAVCNCATILILEKLTFDEIKSQYVERVMKKLKRMRQKVITYGGDHYFEEIPIEEAAELVHLRKEQIHSEDELCRFMEQVLPIRMPYNKPLWEVHVFPDFKENESALIMKVHHAMGDGLSGQFIAMATSDEYDPDNSPHIRDVPEYQQILLYILGFLKVPWVLLKNLMIVGQKNPLINQGHMSGVKLCEVSKDIIFDQVKQKCKELNVTINDYFTSILSLTVFKYFDQNQFNTDFIYVSIPINIRFYKPQTVEEIQIYNKFSLEMISLPLENDFSSVLNKVHKLFEYVKHSSDYMASYLISLFLGTLVPYSLTHKIIFDVSKQVTLVFTNLPGPQNPLLYKGKKTKKAWVTFIPAGSCGISAALYSHNGTLKLGLCADSAMMKNPEMFMRYFEETLDESLEMKRKISH